MTKDLGHEVVDVAVDAMTDQACPIKKALPVAAIIAVGGLVVLGFVKLRRVFKAKKAAKETIIETEEVNPPEAE